MPSPSLLSTTDPCSPTCRELPHHTQRHRAHGNSSPSVAQHVERHLIRHPRRQQPQLHCPPPLQWHHRNRGKLHDPRPQCLLPIRRRRVDDHSNRPRPPHDSWCRLLLLRSRTSKISTVTHMVVHHGHWPHLISMVLLGLLPRLQPHCWQVLRRPDKHRLPQCTRSTVSRLPQDPRSPLCRLPGHVRLHHSRPGHRCSR